MIKMLTAHTLEIDDAELALEEILEQLDLPHSLMKNAAGLMTCYSEFIDTGVLKALCDALPFDVVGATTLGNADNREQSQMMLSLTVLTSDDIEFSAAYSQSIAGDQRAPLAEVFEFAKARLSGEPKLMFTFLPLLYHVGGDETVATLDSITGGVPAFGTIAIDHTLDYRFAQTFMNGECSKDRLAMLLVCGDIEPQFLIASISEDKIIKQKAIITASKGNVLTEVNHMPILKYMETLGLTKDGKLEGANNIPFMVDTGDGTEPLARAIYAVTPEGYAVCGGVMPVNATLAVGATDYNDVMRTTKHTLERALATGKHSGVIMFSCISRYMALGMDAEAEMRLVQKMLPKDLPFQFTYSGGEACPVYDRGGEARSRFHNYTFVVCIF